MVKLVRGHSCVADRLTLVVRFPAGPRVRLKTVDPPKGNGLGQKKKLLSAGQLSAPLYSKRFCTRCQCHNVMDLTCMICAVQLFSQSAALIFIGILLMEKAAVSPHGDIDFPADTVPSL